MSLIRLDNVTKRFGGDPILEGINFRVEEGDKIGLVGRNGCGKSTLFRLLTEEMAPDSGVIEKMRRARFSCLAQFPDYDDTTTILDIAERPFAALRMMETQLSEMEHRIAAGDEAILDKYSASRDEFEHKGGYAFHYQIDRVLCGLGFTREEFALPVRALSGGQRTRMMLALVLLEDADLLLLDEPENHLDIRAREWLETYLRDNRKAFVIISHDRRMLNAVADNIAEIERASLTVYAGNFDAYIAEKQLRAELQQKAFERQLRFIEKEISWISRFRYKATKARQAQSRMKRLDKIERVDAPNAEQKKAAFFLGEVVRSGTEAIVAEGLGMAYEGLKLYGGLDLRVERGERIGIIGPNGSGKTTLLRHLAGTLDASDGKSSGTVKIGHNVIAGFYDQHHQNLHPENDIMTEIRTARPDMLSEQIRTFMGRFLFTGDDIFQPVSTLSGGEMSRVAIAKLVLSGANLLMLDEPTNHLDIPTREILEAALSEYEGTLLVVSHDRVLIDRLAERLWVVENGGVTDHLGDYASWREGQVAGVREEAPSATEDVLMIRSKKEKVQKDRQEKRDSDKERKKRQRAITDLEEDIASLEGLIADYEQRFASLAPDAFDQTRALQSEYDGLRADLKSMYIEWERLVADLE